MKKLINIPMKKITLLLANLFVASMLFGQINIVDDSFYSDALGQEMMVDVYLPPGYEINPDQYYPVVYYLHGYGGNQNNLIYYAPIAYTLMLNGSIDPFLIVCPNNAAGPFGGTMYMDSPLWGDFATYNFTEVVDYIESNYRALSNKNKRALMGQSMGACGCFENGPANKDKFRAIAAHGYPGVFEAIIYDWQAALINEQILEPPYFYNFYAGGIFTQLAFLFSGAFAPNLYSSQTWINPAIVDFICDDQGEIIDSVLSKWLEHSGNKLVQELSQEDDFGILFGCGENDELLLYPGAVALKDSLDAYGISSQFFSHSGGHTMPVSFMTEAYIFLDSIFKIENTSCLPEGITFTTQAEIDNFQINHPNCTEIEGDVSILGVTDTISNLNGLNVLTLIGGDLSICWCPGLTSLAGLDNLTFVGGNLCIGDFEWYTPFNDSLTSITELGNLTTIGGGLQIAWNPCLTGLAGLENLETVGGAINIMHNGSLTSLSALENATTIVGGDLIITGNPALTSLTGLEGLTGIEGDLEISGNDALTSIVGLEGLTIIEEDLKIMGNENLTILTGLDSVTNIGGYLRIHSNNALVSLMGLHNLSSIAAGDYGWSLFVTENDALINLMGLNNLTSIGGQVQIYGNDELTSLTGLENLTSIEGSLRIGQIYDNGQTTWITGNQSLINLSGLNNLNLIGEGLWIMGNDALTSLAGLDNIEAGTINNLSICKNDSLSSCDVESICNYLALPYATVEIHDNAPGCNSPEEVEQACETVSVEKKEISDQLIISPNPFSTSATIEYELSQPGMVEVKIYNQTGQLIEEFLHENGQTGHNKFTWQPTGQPPGIYFIRLQSGENILSHKVIKLK
nr:T9SS type A sorting domain-containing protein [Bacteroidota bacterium]